MRSLFWKIFLSFWMAQALFVVLAILVTWVVHQRGEARQDAAQLKILTEAVSVYEKSGTVAAHNYLEQIHESQHIRSYLFNDRGEEISGHAPTYPFKDVERIQARLRGPMWGLVPPLHVQRLSFTSPAGHRYTIITIQPPNGPFGPRALTWRGILIGIISTGLVCYLLARYLTSPVVRLRAATQKLAKGDLSARAGIAGSRRRDEMAQLVRDFDSMAERLEKLVNAQSRLLNDISHELRSPLARLNVALALARQRSGPEAQSMLDRIDTESDRLNELIERLLTIARLEAGPEGVRKEAVSLPELITEIVEDADFEAQAHKCHVHADLMCDCVVTGNAALLHSAIENVVRNATQYAKPGTDVQVFIDCHEESGRPEAIVRVSDSGPGVPEDTLENLFRPFYRIDDARVRNTGGVGLGLAITDRSVRLHGGSVRANNRKEGGLVVEIRLPIVYRGISTSAGAASPTAALVNPGDH
jgi:two-component system sensor histidine kinase CpxA